MAIVVDLVRVDISRELSVRVLQSSIVERIGIRELRQRACEWIRRVERGESFEVTARYSGRLSPFAPTGR